MPPGAERFRMDDAPAPRAYAWAMSALTVIFFIRVLAQAIVDVHPLYFLPSMQQWTTPSASPFATSGLVPYPLLLSSQIAILLFQIKVCRDFFSGSGYFTSLRSRTGRILGWLAYLYFAAMAFRYAVTMASHPERRWLGHTVPILLHFVLAGFLLALGRYNTRRRAGL
jgi:hypothetical protein